MNTLDARAERRARVIGQTALAATLYEVSAAPKPGLVDPLSVGAHRDMDYFTFLSSAAALAPYFIDFARIGLEGDAAVRAPRSTLLPQLRQKGLEAERAMFTATCGANTHKGLIFSMGLLCAAAGSLAREENAPEERVTREPANAVSKQSLDSKPAASAARAISAEAIARAAAEIVFGICARELAPLTTTNARTSGESLYLRFGVRGIRGEAEAGFPSVIARALPRLRADLAAGATYNDAMIDALLELCLCVDDTTVLNRAGVEGLDYVRAQAAQALACGGMLSADGKAYIYELDADFSARGLSPGGCADLLAVTVFLDKLPEASALLFRGDTPL